MSDMRRREFITLGAGVATWPLAARAQQGERMRRIGVLMAVTERDPESQFRVSAFEAGLRELGWVEGRNLRIEYRWAPDPDLLHRQAAELVAATPDLILANTTPVLAALLRESTTLPMVFVQVTDPTHRRAGPTGFCRETPGSAARPASVPAPIAGRPI